MRPRKSHLRTDPPPVKLSVCSPWQIRSEMQQVQLAVSRRAFELFELRGREHGHDWSDWFRAEAELLRPVSTAISQSEDRVSVRANVLGYEAHELRVSVEPRRIIIIGKREMTATETEGGSKFDYIDWYPDQIMRVIELATEVVPQTAVIELHAGLLKIELPKAAGKAVVTAAWATRGRDPR